jgi:hypothetical protein
MYFDIRAAKFFEEPQRINRAACPRDPNDNSQIASTKIGLCSENGTEHVSVIDAGTDWKL